MVKLTKYRIKKLCELVLDEFPNAMITSQEDTIFEIEFEVDLTPTELKKLEDLIGKKLLKVTS